MLEVSDIGDVAHIAHLVAQMLQIAEYEVESDGGARVAQMSVAVNRGAADIHPHVGSMKRFETFFLTVKGIVYQESLFHKMLICFKIYLYIFKYRMQSYTFYC